MNEQHQADESEVSMRKFLKQLGVTAHQELAKVLAEAVDSGKLSPGEKVLVKAKVELEGIEFKHEIESNLIAPN